jgi:hypothetical protein
MKLFNPRRIYFKVVLREHYALGACNKQELTSIRVTVKEGRKQLDH